MLLPQVLLWIIAEYLLLGSIGACLNFSNVRRRQAYLEKINKLRLEIFQESLGAQIIIYDNVYKIGLGSDEAVGVVNKEAAMQLSESGLTKIVALAHILLGPIPLCGVWYEHKGVKQLELSYLQIVSVVERLRNNRLSNNKADNKTALCVFINIL